MSLAASILVITGPPGAGKTTVAEALADRSEPSVVVSGDEFFHSIRVGYIPPWEPDADDQNATVIRSIAAAADQFAAGGYAVMVDAIVGPWFIEDFLQQVDHRIAYVILRPDQATCLGRATGRGGTRLSDPEPIAHMYRAFEDLGEYERFVIDSTTNDVRETAETVWRMATDQSLLLRP